MKPKELYRLMTKNGWTVKRVNGSHYIMIKGDKMEIIPLHNAEMSKGLSSAIIKKWGLK